MITPNLDKIFNPKSIAVIGASNKINSVGYTLMKNLTELEYKGRVYPVSIRKKEILGFEAYPTVSRLPETVDLAIIATPAKTLEEARELAKAGFDYFTEIEGVQVFKKRK